VLGASTVHGSGQFHPSGESQSPKLPLSRPIPLTPFLPPTSFLANLTENARLFAETRKLLGSGGKVLEVVEDEQEQAPAVAAEFYPLPLNGSSATESTEAASPTETTSERAPSNSPTYRVRKSQNDSAPSERFELRRTSGCVNIKALLRNLVNLR